MLTRRMLTRRMLTCRIVTRRIPVRAGERGSVAVFTAVFAIAIVFLTALIVDGGIALNARARAADIAGQAARAAADNIDVATLRASGNAVIGAGACGLAASLVGAYAGQDNGGVDRVSKASMIGCSAPEGSETATVQVTITTEPLIEGILGGFTETASQSATAECGINEGTEC
jgi:Flp pilus assembly protein TadG